MSPEEYNFYYAENSVLYLTGTKVNRQSQDDAIEEMNEYKFVRHSLIEK
jgi:hypothetical protein